MSNIKIGLQTPFSANIGGGEKYIMTFAEALQDKYDVDFLSSNSDAYLLLQQIINVDLSKVNFKDCANHSIFSFYHYLPKIEYDIFICLSNSIDPPVLGKGKINILIVQFPYRVEYLLSIRKSLKSKVKAFIKTNLKRLLRYDNLVKKSYKRCIVYSDFTRFHVQKQFSGNIDIISPPVHINHLKYHQFSQKKNQIISVGRFVGDQDSKQQLNMVRWFKEFIDIHTHLNLEYFCIGGVSNLSVHQNYLEKVKAEAYGYPIHILTNVNAKDVQKIYSESKVFWHAKGYLIDELFPEFTEHFGISTIESMYSGCVPISYQAGGQIEIVSDGFNGFLWKTKEELLNKTLQVFTNPDKAETMSINAHQSSLTFSDDIFKDKVQKFIENLV